MIPMTNHDPRAMAQDPAPEAPAEASIEAAATAFLEAYNALCRQHGFRIVLQPHLHPDPTDPRGKLLFHFDGSLAVTTGVARLG